MHLFRNVLSIYRGKNWTLKKKNPVTLFNVICDHAKFLIKTRDNRRRFPGTAEKTLHRQGLESVSVEGTTAGEEGEDPLQWQGVRPPEAGLGLQPPLHGGWGKPSSSPSAASPKIRQKPRSKVNSRGPWVVVAYSNYVVITFDYCILYALPLFNIYLLNWC